MATLTINFTPPVKIPANGYIVEYRVKGSTGPYTTVVASGSPVQISGLPHSTEFEGTIKCDCGGGSYSTLVNFSTCTCPVGFVRSTDNNRCQKIETTAPTITQSGYCLAASTNGAYGSYFTRIYNPGFSNSSIGLTTAPSAEVYAELNTDDVWATLAASPSMGPVNRSAVWVDSDCDGVPNALALGAETTIAYSYENTGAVRTVYVGVAADNQFNLSHNGTSVAQTTSPGNVENFKIFHLFPVTLTAGWNDFNVVATGDGTVNDAVAVVIFDNTAAQIAAVADFTAYNALTRLFDTLNLRGTTYEVATCPATYSLDVSGGAGNYICRRTTTQNCGGVPG